MACGHGIAMSAHQTTNTYRLPRCYTDGLGGALSGLAIFASFSHAVTFEVTTAEEFQAALTVAGSNGGDDEIL